MSEIVVTAPSTKFKLTPEIVAAVAHEEGLVLEAYKDSKGIWTWALGVAATGGHDVLQYKDNPSSVEAAVRASIKLMETKYLPAVQDAFDGFRLKDHEIAGALSFHWNTGAIKRASWVKHWKNDNIAEAKKAYMQWRNPPEILARRKRDMAMFFDGVFPDLRVPVFSVRKPAYTPFKPVLTNLMPVIQQVMGGR